MENKEGIENKYTTNEYVIDDDITNLKLSIKDEDYTGEDYISLRKGNMYIVCKKGSIRYLPTIYKGVFIGEINGMLHFDCSEKYKSNKKSLNISDISYIEEVKDDE